MTTPNWEALLKLSQGNATPAPKVIRSPRKVQAAEFQPLQKAFSDLSLDGLANAYMWEARNRFRYIPQNEKWLKWDGHVWVWDTLNALREDIKEFLRGIKLAPTLDTETKKHQVAAYNRFIEPTGINAFITHIRTDALMVADLTEFDQETYDLNTPSGVVDLVTGEITEPTPAHLFRRSTTVSPDASVSTEKYDRLLSEAFAGRPELATYFNTMMGITLVNAQDVQVFMYMYGAAGSGKGTLMNVAQSILGKGDNGYSQSVDSTLFVKSRQQHHPTEMMQFHGARMVVSSEITDGEAMDTGKLKKTTGGDPITGRYMGKDYVTFEPTHTLWLMANSRLKVPHDDKGVWRRLRVLPFDFSAQTNITGLANIIFQDEGPGILAKWIECAQDYLNNGYVTPTAVEDAGDEYVKDQDTVAAWLEDCADTSNAAAYILAGAAASSYKNWCKLWNKTPLNRNEFAKALEDKGFSTAKKRISNDSSGPQSVRMGLSLHTTMVSQF